MQITTLGDSALIVRVCDNFADPEKALEAVLRAQGAIEAARISGVIECAPAYTAVGVFYDPVAVVAGGAPRHDISGWVGEKISRALSIKSQKTKSPRKPFIDVPVCYDPRFALDLDDVAQHAKLSPTEVVDLHCRADYRVSCVGFTPGFPYLTGLPDELAAPRRASPRKQVPAGSVAIGGAQTGIYPLTSPGGWNIIGRTPLRLFDAAKNPPTLLSAGDRVRFRAITREEFDALA